jgi:sugar phosphate isomerase/epimerase
MTQVTFTVFSKPWKLPLPELASHVAALGFDGVEFPVRPGYPVTPDNIATELPNAVRILGDAGLKIGSIAGPTDEKTMAACAASGVPIIRICVGMHSGEDYMEGEARLQREFDALVPLLARHGVTLGIQNHIANNVGDRAVCNAMCARHLVEKFDPKQVAIVWDAGHNGLEGEPPEMAIDIVWSHLCLVNLKSAIWQLTSGPEADVATWKSYWTTARHGRANWPRVASELRKRGFSGDICLTAEYSDESSVDRLIADDIAFARSLFV